MLRLLFGFSLFFSTVSHASRIINVVATPVNEGNVTVSETVRVDVLTDNTDKNFTLIVNAVVVNGEQDEAMKDAGGDTVIDFEVPALPDTEPFRITTKEFKVAMADLKLPNGKGIKLGFVAASVSGGKRVSEMASDMQLVSVEGKVRFVAPPPPAPVEEKKIIDAIIVRNDGTKETGSVTVYPSQEKDGSVSLEKQAAEAAEKAKSKPNALASIRTDKELLALANENDQTVYFATTRRMDRAGRPNQYNFHAELRAEGLAGLTYGTCKVNLPTREQEQALFSKQKAALLGTYPFNGTEEDFLKTLSNATSKDVFFYVHGYANSFEDAILQAARMKRDLQFAGNVFAYSWPSKGLPTLSAYLADQRLSDDKENLEVFAHVFEKVVQRAHLAGGKVFFLPHSMGNRYGAYALRKLYLSDFGKTLAAEKKYKRTLQMVAFAAPDVDVNIFSGILPSVASMSNLVSFYYSTKDRALELSEIIHDLDRAGQHPVFNDAVATINLDKQNGWFSLGHSTYSSSDRAVLDLLLQVRYRQAPTSRLPPLEADPAGELKYLFKHWFLI